MLEDKRGGTLPLMELRMLGSALPVCGSGTSSLGSGALGVLVNMVVDVDGDGGGRDGIVLVPTLVQEPIAVPDVPDPEATAPPPAPPPPLFPASILSFPLPSTVRTNGTNLLLGGFIFS